MVILNRSGDSDTTLVDLVEEQQLRKNNLNGLHLNLILPTEADIGSQHDHADEHVGLTLELSSEDEFECRDFPLALASTSAAAASDCSASASASVSCAKTTHLFIGDSDNCNQALHQQTPLVLPDSRSSTPLDECLPRNSLAYNNLVEDSTLRLCGNTPRSFIDSVSDSDSDPILYVDQREVAHATSDQAEWLVTHKATTCHMMAIRSSSTSCATPLSTLAHLDAPEYDDCLRDIIQHHVNYQQAQPQPDATGTANIHLEIHLVGGFVIPDSDSASDNTTNNESQAMTSWLLNQLADISNDYKSASSTSSKVHMELKTCLLSSANTQWQQHQQHQHQHYQYQYQDVAVGPLVRGIALNTRTGEVVAVDKVDSSLCGPQQLLRQTRLWSNCGSSNSTNNKSKLATIHSNNNNNTTLTIEPFHFSWESELQLLLQLPTDQHLIYYTSTSPQQEQHPVEFCRMVRSTLQFMKSNKATDLFGKSCDRSLRYQRISNSNRWQRV